MKKILTILTLFFMNISCFSGILGPAFQQLWVQKYLCCPDDNHPHAIDLGLPSGTKWACCNISDDLPQPTDHGVFYAWGETETKDFFHWITYTHCDGLEETCNHIGNNISGTQYDVAHMEWGGLWRMPSVKQFHELVDYCAAKWTVTGLKGCYGLLITGPNGNTIFLPAAGGCWCYDNVYSEEFGYYWSSSLDPDNDGNAYLFIFEREHWKWDASHYRALGLSVRPVR